jgi:hypothetical protein
MTGQAFNTVFCLCGLVGAVYGIGQKSESLDPKSMRIALMVRGLSNIRATSLTHLFSVVVA